MYVSRNIRISCEMISVLLELIIRMEGLKERRANKIASIRTQLSGSKVMRKNTMIIEEKEERNRMRRQSLQVATQDEANQLRLQFSNEDQEQDNNSITLFLETYRLLHKLGEGANAIVHACQHRLTGQTFAVKKISSKDEQSMIELRRNFLSMQQLHHVNIIRHKELYLDLTKKVAYLVMELYEYPSLTEYIGKLEEKVMKDVFSQLFDAIDYMHLRNTCHRDIKPQNILINPDNHQIKLIDFGISKRTFLRGVKRDMLTRIGTNLYLAPEVLLGGGYDQKVDMWSAGVTLYQMFIGYTPFESEYKGDVVENILKGKPDFSQETWKGHILLKDLTSWLMKPANQRLTASEAQRHLWFNPPIRPPRSPLDKERKSSAEEGLGHSDKVRRNVHRAFHEEQYDQGPFSRSREEGHSPSSGIRNMRPRVLTPAGLYQNENFELLESTQASLFLKGNEGETSGQSPPAKEDQ